MSNQQPNPSPPDSRPVPPPSWLTYFVLTTISVILILVAFSISSPDLPGLLINLASGIITAIMFLVIIDRKFRVNEFSALQVKTSTFTTQFASIFSADIADTVGYAKVFASQIRKIRPSYYVERPEFENLLEKFPNGFFISGLEGIGKTTLVQTIAIKYSEELIVKPKGKIIPVLIPVKNWHSGNIVEQVYNEIDKFYPVRTKVLQNWLKNKPILLIFDGLDEHTNPDTVMMEIETLRKLGNNLIVIVTSRSINKNSGLPKVALPGFTEKETKRQIELIGGSPEALAEVISLHSQKRPRTKAENLSLDAQFSTQVLKKYIRTKNGSKILSFVIRNNSEHDLQVNLAELVFDTDALLVTRDISSRNNPKITGLLTCKLLFNDESESKLIPSKGETRLDLFLQRQFTASETSTITSVRLGYIRVKGVFCETEIMFHLYV